MLVLGEITLEGTQRQTKVLNKILREIRLIVDFIQTSALTNGTTLARIKQRHYKSVSAVAYLDLGLF